MVVSEYRLGFVGKRSLNEAMSESNYITNAQNYMTEKLHELLKGMSLPEELADQMLEEDESYLEITNYIDAVYDGNRAAFDTTQFRENFINVINQYLLEHNISVSEQLQQSVETAAKSAEHTYRQYIEPTFADTLYQLNEKYSQKVVIVLIVSILMAAVIITILLLLYHYKHHAIRYLVYSLIAAIGLNLLVSFRLVGVDLQKKLGVGPQYYLDFLHQYLKGGAILGIAVSVVAVAVVIVVAAVGRQLKRTIK